MRITYEVGIDDAADFVAYRLSTPMKVGCSTYRNRDPHDQRHDGRYRGQFGAAGHLDGHYGWAVRAVLVLVDQVAGSAHMRAL